MEIPKSTHRESRIIFRAFVKVKAKENVKCNPIEILIGRKISWKCKQYGRLPCFLKVSAALINSFSKRHCWWLTQVLNPTSKHADKRESSLPLKNTHSPWQVLCIFDYVIDRRFLDYFSPTIFSFLNESRTLIFHFRTTKGSTSLQSSSQFIPNNSQP